MPDPGAVYRAIRAAQADFADALAITRRAVERGAEHVLVAELPDHVVYITGCMSVGDTPFEPFEAFCYFGESGMATAAGFDGWTRYCHIALEDRKLDSFDEAELRTIEDATAHAAAGFSAPKRGRSVKPGKRTVDRRYENYLAWLAAPAIDIEAAADAVERVDDPELRRQLRADLQPLTDVTAGEEPPVVASAQVGNLTLWLTADQWGNGWTVEGPLRRLGAAGVLAAAGAVAWSGPVVEVPRKPALRQRRRRR